MAFYAVARGRNPGIYHTWAECKTNVDGFSGAAFKKFPTRPEAQNFIEANKSQEAHSASKPEPTIQRELGANSDNRVTKPARKAVSTPKAVSIPSVLEISKDAVSSKVPDHFPGEQTVSVSQNPAKSGTSTHIYVDGASRGNGKSSVPKSGYGVYYGPNDKRNAAVPLSKVDNVWKIRPTNQRAELHAIHHALKNIKSELESGESSDTYVIFTDSMYVKNCLDTWAKKWKNNNWQTGSVSKSGSSIIKSSKHNVANRDIIENAYYLLQELREKTSVEIRHVKGHSGDFGNESADRLANQGADQM